MWFIGVEVEQETSAPPPEKNPGSAPVRTVSKFRKRKRKLSSCVPALNKREIRHFHVVVVER